MAVNGFIFDFDGVIADTEPLHYRAFCDVVEPYGMGCSWEEYVADYIGYDDRDLFLCAFKVSGRAVSSEELQQLIALKAARFVEIVNDQEVRSYDGVVELIKCIRDDAVPLALCSGALRSDVDPVLKRFGLEDAFDIISTAEDVPASKPDPAPYRHALQALSRQYPEHNLAAGQCVAFEDTPAGVASAGTAGLRVVAITNTHSEDGLKGADAIVETLAELTPDDIRRMVGFCV